MKKNAFKRYKLPDSPGIYFFKKGRRVIYVGKATSLRDRVKSYFSPDLPAARGLRIKMMITEATGLSWRSTGSVLEALLTETALIKKLKPKYNTRERDDKSYLYVVITKESWPRILAIRGRDLATKIDPEKVKYSFGPFPSAGELRIALGIIRKIFPFRDKCSPAQLLTTKVGRVNSPKPCFNRQIGLCPGICTSEISQKDYRRQVNHIRLLFAGKRQTLIKRLEKEMTEAAKNSEFEKAVQIRNQIFALNHIRDVALIKKDRSKPRIGFRIEAYDIAHLAGRETVGVMAVVTDGEPAKNEYRRFKLRGPTAKTVNDPANLKEIIKRRLNHSDWSRPDLLVVDGGRAQINAAAGILKKAGWAVPLVGVVKDEKHRPKNIIGNKPAASLSADEILLAAGEAHRFAINYHRGRLRKRI